VLQTLGFHFGSWMRLISFSGLSICPDPPQPSRSKPLHIHIAFIHNRHLSMTHMEDIRQPMIPIPDSLMAPNYEDMNRTRSLPERQPVEIRCAIMVVCESRKLSDAEEMGGIVNYLNLSGMTVCSD